MNSRLCGLLLFLFEASVGRTRLDYGADENLCAEQESAGHERTPNDSHDALSLSPFLTGHTGDKCVCMACWAEEGQAWRAERKRSVSSPETYLGFGICTFAVS